jgi:PAS domain S-box-containing protein
MVKTATALSNMELLSQAALADSEALFRAMADDLPLIVWLHGPDGEQQFVNQTFCDYFGVTRQEMKDGKWQLLTHPDAGTSYVDAFLTSVREQRIFHAETRVRRSDGAWRWIESWGRPRFDEGGNYLGHVGASADVTERKATEEALAQSESRLRRVFDSIDEGYSLCEMILGADGKAVDYRFIEVNPLFEQMTGIKDPVGRTAYSMVPGLEPFWLEIYTRVALGGETLRFEHGSQVMGRYFDVFSTPVPPLGRFVIVFKDVTARKRTEAALQESEQRAQRILESITDGFIAVDQGWRITFLNPRGEEILRPLGKSRDHLLGKVLWEEFPYLIGTPFEACYRRAAQERVTTNVEAFFPPLDSWFDVRAYPSPDGIAIHFQDIGERKRAEIHRELLVNELNHRVKNTLAIVQGVARQTFRGITVAHGAYQAYEGRLQAISDAHNLLTQENWESVSLRDLAVLAVQAEKSHQGRVRLNGPAIMLQPKQAVTLAMALHELTTNALKHGALSGSSGRIELTWSAVKGAERQLTLVWRELNGPAVRPPRTRGFGLRMIEQALAQELDGTVTMEFRPEGLVCTIQGVLPSPQQPPAQ